MSSDEKPPEHAEHAEHRLIAERRAKLAAMRAGDAIAYPNDFRPTHQAAAIAQDYADLDREALAAKSVPVCIAGRLMLRRVMGKASFITLQDESGQLQCYLKAKEIGDADYDLFKKYVDLGDILGVTGALMRTNTGELTLAADSVRLLAKALRPLPDKHMGLVDTEMKYRQRYVDLIADPEARRRFRLRSKIVAAMRAFFLERDFLEVETPLMHPIPGGATARPFITHHNTLDMDLYLRVAPELYLKRLVVGGFERVFELNRNFRNEGLSQRHNPEFTMLEWYQCYVNHNDLMTLTEELIASVLAAVGLDAELQYQGQPLNLKPPYRRMSLLESLCEYTGEAAAALRDADHLATLLRTQEVAVVPAWGVGKRQMALFEAVVERRLTQPVFITDYPTEVSPLARRNDQNPDVADRFELFVAGREIANGFCELNDPEDQVRRFKDQANAASAGDLEAMHYDADYVRALEYGMPPVAGEGVGVDRLVMLLTDAPSIRDVLLFPQLKPKSPVRESR